MLLPQQPTTELGLVRQVAKDVQCQHTSRALGRYLVARHTVRFRRHVADDLFEWLNQAGFDRHLLAAFVEFTQLKQCHECILVNSLIIPSIHPSNQSINQYISISLLLQSQSWPQQHTARISGSLAKRLNSSPRNPTSRGTKPSTSKAGRMLGSSDKRATIRINVALSCKVQVHSGSRSRVRASRISALHVHV